MQLSRETTATRFIHGFWAMRQAFVQRVAPTVREAHGLELPEVFLMQYVGGSDLSPSEIAETMRLPAHMISRKLDGLGRRGLVTRSLDPHDARRRVLTLTPAGETLLEGALATLDAQVLAFLAVLEPDALEAMLGAMESLGGSAQPVKETL